MVSSPPAPLTQGHSSPPGLPVNALSFGETVSLVIGAAMGAENRMVCAADVHMVMRHHEEPDFREVLAQADLITPDGMPLVWLLRRQGYRDQQRVCGPDLLPALCAEAREKGLPIGFYGGRPDVLEALIQRLTARFPGLTVAYAYSPPFRSLTPDEEAAELQAIQAAGIRMLFVGLGCPKQERWMAAHKGQVPAVMIGIGAAFDFHAGAVRRAPAWMQRWGMEWAFRATQQPRHILRRLFRYHLRFLWHMLLGTPLVKAIPPAEPDPSSGGASRPDAPPRSFP